VTLASGDPDDALTISTDARVLGATLAAGNTLDLELDPERYAYLVASMARVAILQARATALPSPASTWSRSARRKMRR